MTRPKQRTEDGRFITRTSNEWKDTIHFNNDDKIFCKVRAFMPVTTKMKEAVTCKKCLYYFKKAGL
jgi:hypothetical protein